MKPLALSLLLLALSLSACDAVTDSADGEAALGRKAKVELCHYSADDDAFYYIEVGQRAEDAHLAHGDLAYDADDDENPDDGIFCEPEPEDEGDGGGDPAEIVLFGTGSQTDALFTIDRPTGAITTVGPLDPVDNTYAVPSVMATAPDGTIYIGNFFTLLTADPCTGLATPIGNGTSWPIDALAHDPTTGTLYGLFANILFEIDKTTGAQTTIGSWSTSTHGRAYGAAFAPDGTLYALTSYGSGDPLGLLTIDPATGNVTSLRALDAGLGRPDALEFTPDGTLLGSSSGSNDTGSFNILFEIDLPNTSTSTVVELETQVQGLGFAPACN